MWKPPRAEKPWRCRAGFKFDFVDAYNVLIMRKRGIREIYSLDEHYDVFRDIKRVV
jgi:predicted nucleic acid-binding protein